PVIFGDYRQTLIYLNKAAFAAVSLAAASGASIRPGNLGRYAIRAPGAWTLDSTLAKNFALTERWKLQLRGDLERPRPSIIWTLPVVSEGAVVISYARCLQGPAVASRGHCQLFPCSCSG